jgi:hypothetical protein
LSGEFGVGVGVMVTGVGTSVGVAGVAVGVRTMEPSMPQAIGLACAGKSFGSLSLTQGVTTIRKLPSVVAKVPSSA